TSWSAATCPTASAARGPTRPARGRASPCRSAPTARTPPPTPDSRHRRAYRGRPPARSERGAGAALRSPGTALSEAGWAAALQLPTHDQLLHVPRALPDVHDLDVAVPLLDQVLLAVAGVAHQQHAAGDDVLAERARVGLGLGGLALVGDVPVHQPRRPGDHQPAALEGGVHPAQLVVDPVPPPRGELRAG